VHGKVLTTEIRSLCSFAKARLAKIPFIKVYSRERRAKQFFADHLTWLSGE
jgi:hypothetical protein